MIKRLKRFIPYVFVFTCTTSCTECKAPVSLPDNYAVARAVVQGSQLALFAADGVFEFLCTLSSKAADARPTYLLIRADVATGLQLALEGIMVAETQKQGFDLSKLMAQAETSWQKVKEFLLALEASINPPASNSASMKTIASTRRLSARDLPPTLLR